ncbi:NUDIX hydrolase [Arthrobacter sp. ISL-85]|uniref:NUDIX hydrolase n=1 Tax=Arthrobacter sp. ISL-85 TaxID=2819115 RepID=UPI001BEA545E|nr:NUDIX hydrolase [Arthrobacter sp. ISL-85]MBT2565214.1 NUDIX hydrolase [Arthrobacter sp. ISL-85]
MSSTTYEGRDATGLSAPRLAVSVVLMRNSAHGVGVFVQRRALTMDFAAGVVAFPGGRVEAVDSSPSAPNIPLLDSQVRAWRRTSVGTDASFARQTTARLLAAAIREVAEECDVVLQPTALVPWANWITPEGFPKRFDTFFFVTAVAPKVEPRHVTTEATSSEWISVRRLLQDEGAGRLKLLPPTIAILDELVEAHTTEEVLSVKRPIDPVCLQLSEIEAFRLRRQRMTKDTGEQP